MVKRFVPLFIKKSLRNRAKILFGFKDLPDLKPELIAIRENEERRIPKFELAQKHIDNLKIVLDRTALLEQMPKNAVCAEIGVDRGQFSDEIIRITRPLTLHLIDAWGDPNRYSDELKEAVRKKFATEMKEGKVEMHIGFSTTQLKKFPDRFFDWVYLDTDHTYQTSHDELLILKDKVKQNGIIAGHDYTLGNWIGSFRYGVIEAVHELCVTENWELIYLTNETHQCRSFAIRKLL
jgi:hypothetical protein